MLRSIISLSLALGLLASCGPPMVYQGPPPDEKPAPPPEPKVDYARRGVPKPMGAEIEIIGYQTVWLEGTKLLITLKSTAWDELDGVREGRAELVVEHDGDTATVTVVEGTSKQVDGFTIELKYAHELYQKGVWEPHAKFVVSR